MMERKDTRHACACRAGDLVLPSKKRVEGAVSEAAAKYYKDFCKNLDERVKEMNPLVRHIFLVMRFFSNAFFYSGLVPLFSLVASLAHRHCQ